MENSLQESSGISSLLDVHMVISLDFIMESNQIQTKATFLCNYVFLTSVCEL